MYCTQDDTPYGCIHHGIGLQLSNVPTAECTSGLNVMGSSLQVYHPNIDLEGNICLNILREDWKPVLSISSVIYGLQFLFLVSSVFWLHT